MNKPKISVITTVRNGEKFILETLHSVNKQTYRPIEHVIVDDGSQDATISIIETFKKQNLDYEIVLFQPNLLDRGKTLNYAISQSSGEWVAIIDADDLWHPEKLWEQYKYVASKYVDIIATNGNIFTNSSDIIYSNNKETEKNFTPIFLKNLLMSNVIIHSSVLMKKELCSYDENRKSQYDYELWLRLANQGYTIIKLNNQYTFHRIHLNQSFEGKMGKKYRWRSFLLQTKYISKNAKNITIYPIIVAKFIFYDMLLSRNLRLFIRKKCNIE